MYTFKGSALSFDWNIERWGPSIIQALCILFFGIGLAFLLKHLAQFFFKRLGNQPSNLSPYLSARQIAGFTKVLSQIVFWMTIIAFVVFSTEAFEINILQTWVTAFAHLVPKIFSAAVVFALGMLLAKLLRNLVRTSGRSIDLNHTERLAAFVYGLGVLTAVLVAVRQIGIEIEFLTSLVLIVIACLLVGGAISFGVGSAPIVTDLLAGYYMKKLIKPGTHLQIKGLKGEVISAHKTSFLLRDGHKEYIVPARQISQAIVQVDAS